MAVTDKPSFEPKPFGRYVLLDKLAMGGMAEIYKAKTYGVDGFEKLLAIKRILPHCAADHEFIRMLVDEAKLTVLLSHANIVQVFDLGKVGEDYFISMEFINGTNLRELLNRHKNAGKLVEEIAVYIISEVCKGLDYAHRKADSQGNPLHIVHRDISPQNILISYEGEVKIVDFGIAKAAMNISHTMAGILKGKVGYMSPEQAMGKPIDHRTDIFSTGVLLYEMLTGEKLYSGETQFEVLNQIRTTRVTTLMLPDSISGPLKAILAKALAYNLKDRYQSAGDFQLDLTKYLYSSYIDFSPRQLAATVSKLFQSEMKRKESPVSLDDKTRSVMMQQTAQENIVVHKPSRSSEKLADTKAGFEAAATEPGVLKKSMGKWVLGSLLALAVAGYFGYEKFVKTPPVIETPPPPISQEFPATPVGSVEVSSNPAGASVFLNGKDTGLTTPNTLSKLPLGEDYQIRLSKENYADATKTLTLVSEVPVKMSENLSPLAKGMIDLSSNPVGARIFLNNQDTGLSTPATLQNLEIQKSYDIKLSIPGYVDWIGTAEVRDFSPVKFQASLAALPPTPVAPAPQPAPPVAQPTPPSVKYGRVRVTSEPAGARIYLNGEDTGRTTPATLDRLEAGRSARISLIKKGFQDVSRTVTVEADRTSPVVASLESLAPPPSQPRPAPTPSAEPQTIDGQPGTISVNSDPSGADVFVNAEYKGTTPIKISNVSPGSMKITVSKEGLLKQSTMVRLSPGENKSLGTIRLGNLYGEISIASTPPRAAVYFDGEKIGARTPVTIRKVPRDQQHTVKIELEGYRSWESNVNMSDQENKRFDVQLEKD